MRQAVQQPSITQCMRERHLDGLRIADLRYAAHHTQPMHQHHALCINVVLAGHYVESGAHGSRSCAPASIIVRPPGEPHATTIGPRPVRCLRIEPDEAWMQAHAETLPTATHSRDVGLMRTEILGYRIYQQFHGTSDLATAALTLHVGEAMAALSPPSRVRAAAWLDLVVDRLRATFTSPIRVADLARDTPVTPIHLGRLFRQHTGHTIPRFVLQLRTALACGLLLDGNEPLVEVALRAGFVDQSHLTRALVRFTGLSPARFRDGLGWSRAERKSIQDTSQRLGKVAAIRAEG